MKTVRWLWLSLGTLCLCSCGPSGCARENILGNGKGDDPPPNWWDLSVTEVVEYACVLGAAMGSAMFFIGIALAIFTSRNTSKIIIGGLAMIFAASILGLLVLWLKVATWIAVICCLIGAGVYVYFHRKAAIWWIERKTGMEIDGKPGLGEPDEMDEATTALEPKGGSDAN